MKRIDVLARDGKETGFHRASAVLPRHFHSFSPFCTRIVSQCKETMVLYRKDSID